LRISGGFDAAIAFPRDPRLYALLCLGTMTLLIDSADHQSMRLALVARHIVAGFTLEPTDIGRRSSTGSGPTIAVRLFRRCAPRGTGRRTSDVVDFKRKHMDLSAETTKVSEHRIAVWLAEC
jgi:hypothetical protein